jgi:hypothetical protein
LPATSRRRCQPTTTTCRPHAPKLTVTLILSLAKVVAHLSTFTPTRSFASPRAVATQHRPPSCRHRPTSAAPSIVCRTAFSLCHVGAARSRCCLLDGSSLRSPSGMAAASVSSPTYLRCSPTPAAAPVTFGPSPHHRFFSTRVRHCGAPSVVSIRLSFRPNRSHVPSSSFSRCPRSTSQPGAAGIDGHRHRHRLGSKLPCLLCFCHRLPAHEPAS